MKPLFIPLKAEHYDAFDDGSKVNAVSYTHLTLPTKA